MDSSDKIKLGLNELEESNKLTKFKKSDIFNKEGLFVIFNDDATGTVTFKFCPTINELEHLIKNMLLEDNEYIVIKGKLMKDKSLSFVEFLTLQLNM